MQDDKIACVADDPSPTSGIRGVASAGFLAGNACGFHYLLYSGHLLEAIRQNPLALFGAVLGIGIVGTMAGCFIGLGSRMMLQKARSGAGWWLPIILASITSAAVGVGFAWFLVALIWDSNL